MRVAIDKDVARASVRVWMLDGPSNGKGVVYVPETRDDGAKVYPAAEDGLADFRPSLVIPEHYAQALYLELHAMFGQQSPSADRLRGQEYAMEKVEAHLEDLRRMAFWTIGELANEQG